MPYTLMIRKSATGEERLCPKTDDWNTNVHFHWQHNNGSCDCVREEEFMKAGGETPDEDIPCSDGRYVVVKAILPDGTEIPIDAPALSS